jgi:hypothetical protein
LRRYYQEVKSIAADKFSITFDQFKNIYKRLFSIWTLHYVSAVHVILPATAGTEEQKKTEEKMVLDNLRADYEDALIVLGI